MTIENHPFKTNTAGHLLIGGLDASELVHEYGTPIYVYDVEVIRDNCRSFVNAFEQLGVKSQVNYASKAFSSIAVLQVMEEEGLSIDVVSAGELYTAIQADFPSEKIHFHGNNKSKEELQLAIDYDIGCVVVDNFYEIQLLTNLLKKQQKTMDVLIRVTPGIESETHEYIMTGNEDSKFGFNIQNGQADEALQQLHQHPFLNLKGIHSHIGSQIFNTKSFTLSIEMVYASIEKWHKQYGFVPDILNVGGGFGIRYTKEDTPIANQRYISEIVRKIGEESKKLQMKMPEIWIEPGRSIVGEAGVTLYQVGSTKDIAGVRKYIAVDGGMSDNIRPALYQAKYDAVIANKVNYETEEIVSIAGKCCESGDMLVWDVPLPEVEHGDIVAMFSTGAYGYSMASNYNRLPKPGVVFVENGHSQLVIQGEKLEDIVRLDKPYRSVTRL
ncbi:MAG TPA: diaminopimelate decarboxylase [Pseudogracilibacillus sp.]|nr:diaminopimelate decarboxylase [Pseudogracilibacillus sp.]